MVVASADDLRDTHLLRGVLDMCVLTVLAIEPTHAYQVVERLRNHGFATVSYGTIYPLVTRLRRQGLLAQEAIPSPSGPPRNVLAITPAGRRTLIDWRDRWERTTAAATKVMTDFDRTERPRG